MKEWSQHLLPRKQIVIILRRFHGFVSSLLLYEIYIFWISSFISLKKIGAQTPSEVLTLNQNY